MKKSSDSPTPLQVPPCWMWIEGVQPCWMWIEGVQPCWMWIEGVQLLKILPSYNDSANCVVLKYHCRSGFLSTLKNYSKQ